jgi:RNA polymerase sigma-70 factor (ECF subfamily)
MKSVDELTNPTTANLADELSLIAQAQAGDRSAFGELVSRHYEGVIRVVYRMCGDAQLAEDAAQEAFMRAWVSLPGFESRAPFRSWLYRIALNAALDSLRRKPAEDLDDSEESMLLADGDQSPEAAYLEKEQARQVQGAIMTLPKASRAVLVLREYGGLAYGEIAAALDIPAGTVMSRLSYARNLLREQLIENHLETEQSYA